MSKYEKIKLDNQICFPLYALSREVIKLYKPILDKYNLTYTQYITMLVVWEEEKIIFKDLGKKLHLDSGTLTPVIKRLEEMGLIIKYRNKEDDRVVTIELTEKGKLLKDKVIEVPERIYCKFKGKEENLILLKRLLDELLSEYN
ncbi:MarR family winged helix-turn-helix transcriptional regulator [Tissierella praeacuta]|uniref:HTH-type transcriptional regulator SarZ n=1 Tax=Tissierella praeacuta DSM 18095 TaxID=1123404 RepID=A0A1M4TIU3_9FIRM|nr:MarR family transcriptional regulator [Tissierella praeacuta]MBU5256918.1 MarR family transcriptional regulator [Tissierella praeacuta]TCU77499.1 MarR family transcriptional regulator [Tissierella praeacuta]SHE44356.1 DNA-binding transcriptional regulator, MarR family [Tissierella praeacuta DSM 18095]SUP04593.1 Organic hydroperoxide resistance transcriptional regulator [Tissierella praeacuta]